MENLNFKKITSILATKFLSPNLAEGLVERPELLARLEHGLRSHRLTLLSAPAGSGKTTLAVNWLNENRFKSVRARVGWLTLDAGNNYWRAFWQYFIAACQKIWPESRVNALEMLAEGEPLQEVLTAFLNELAGLPGSGVLVLEDFHQIFSPEIHRTLAFLIDHLPRQLRILLLTRQEPFLPLARWRASGDLYTIPADELRFSLLNTQKYLGQHLEVTLSVEVVKRFHEQIGGWPGGIILAAQGAKALRSGEAELFLNEIKGDYPPIRNFIINEIVDKQPEKLKEFLLKTCFLNRLNPALAETVTGLSESRLLLEELANEKFFLVRQESGEKWYVYREFFAEALRFQARHRFEDSSLKELAGKASRWYEQNGCLEEAVEVAFAARDFERAGDLLETFMHPGRLQTTIFRVRGWFEQMPEKVWQARPALCLNYAVVLLFTSDRAQPATRLQVEVPLQIAEKMWRAEENWPSLGALMAFRSCLIWFQGDYRQNLACIGQALEWLPEDENYWRGIALCNLVPHELFEGRLNSAMFLLREALRLCVLSDNQYSKRAGLALLAEVYKHQLELDQAIQIYNQIIEEAAADPSDRCQTFYNLAQLYFSRNELDTATRYLEQAVELNREVGDELLQIKCSLLLIRLKNLRCEAVQAEKLVQMLVARTQSWPLLLREVEAYQAQFAIARGEERTARTWSVMLGSLSAEGPRILLEREGLVQVRLLMAQKKFEMAHSLLAKWLGEAQAQGRSASECEIWFLMARAYFGAGNKSEAVPALQQALALAQPQNFSQVFLEEGVAAAGFFQAVLPGISDPALLAFGRSLLRGKILPGPLTALRQPALALAPARLMAVPQTLSRQEQRVLRLITEGLSNLEIAEELVVSVNTVKSQVKSIYRKLDINSRREARQVAFQTLSA